MKRGKHEPSTTQNRVRSEREPEPELELELEPERERELEPELLDEKGQTTLVRINSLSRDKLRTIARRAHRSMRGQLEAMIDEYEKGYIDASNEKQS